MTGKASDVAARLGRSLTSTAPAQSPISSRDEKHAVSPTERFTVDLPVELNDELARWATQRKRTVGRRVHKTEVVRVLIELLLADPSLAAQVEDRLREK